MAANGQDGVRRIHLVKELLEDRNQLGETPLYGAVALGQTKMAKFLAKKVGHISNHFQRNDGVSILHIAVIGQHFGLPSQLEGDTDNDDDADNDGDEAQTPSSQLKDLERGRGSNILRKSNEHFSLSMYTRNNCS
ncbi:ankyrin repeat-containing protein itn1 [Fagus crenata]